jgi:hypothetical protein
MFGSPLPVDEFRNLLKEHLSYSEEEGSWESDAMQEISRLARVRDSQIEGWLHGTARPHPDLEKNLITLMKGLRNFKQAPVEQP